MTLQLEGSLPELAAVDRAKPRETWLRLWWKVVDYNIGVVPLPIFVVLVGIIGYYSWIGKLSGEITMAIGLLSVGGFACGELGKRMPILNKVGAAAIFATFIPSALAFYHLLPAEVVRVTTQFSKQSQFLYLFIACIIVGSIFAMDRQVLIKGFLKIFVPLAVGSVAAGIVGTLVGVALGKSAYETFFFIVVPIMAGGVGEGAIPLSIGYSEILHQPQGEMFATVLPCVMLGSLTAILLSGALNTIGKRYPHLTGEGQLQPGVANDVAATEERVDPATIGPGVVAGALITACTFYLLGMLVYKLTGLPGPVAMLFLAVAIKLGRLVSPKLQAGAGVVYKFFQVSVTFPLLFAVGVSITPWDKLVAAFNFTHLAIIISTVVTLMGTGFLVGRKIGMYPIEAAIVNACHSGQGGTGDVAILTAANRMVLMPFAQIATRIGGAITVTLVLIFLAHIV
ncbi:2-hydroxycarboxylate transporter family protein [Rhodoplanes sp. TEM]|uniref:2-hydroxycarboxylate transporter family protein n=1 Tax=Rhodoplanes tepidamans TaxID=200616 RepID=A0ABT5J604_RHOTP|nr:MULTISPECIES: 2-hydroxycarboxylate transporter family protein [Rhodoplanes]MDC7785069.1 2-hydroxycarboxylate transporter family protein [Rhodoplanes tepidamans]MDC7982543.1 2-hydroxycarboxylate transporter family protein [Rhodoplanes sp. TEM]MDQ0356558.1 CCS family citrate carrier protein [Rhodoplanes tepidamans]